MGYNMEAKKDNLIVHFYGELDHHISEGARKDIDKKYLQMNLKNIILDFSNLSLMDSSGIGLVMGRYKNVLERKGKVTLISSNVYIDRIINMSGLRKIVDVHTDLKSALEINNEVK